MAAVTGRAYRQDSNRDVNGESERKRARQKEKSSKGLVGGEGVECDRGMLSAPPGYPGQTGSTMELTQHLG